jgi:hypothetical protein
VSIYHTTKACLGLPICTGPALVSTKHVDANTGQLQKVRRPVDAFAYRRLLTRTPPFCKIAGSAECSFWAHGCSLFSFQTRGDLNYVSIWLKLSRSGHLVRVTPFILPVIYLLTSRPGKAYVGTYKLQASNDVFSFLQQ